MNASDGLSWVCQNQDVVDPILTWAAGSIIASAAAWCSTKWNILPSWAQKILQVLSGNLLHAALGEPTPSSAMSAPVGGTPNTTKPGG